MRDVAVTIITKTTVNGGQTIHGSLVFAVHYTLKVFFIKKKIIYEDAELLQGIQSVQKYAKFTEEKFQLYNAETAIRNFDSILKVCCHFISARID